MLKFEDGFVSRGFSNFRSVCKIRHSLIFQGLTFLCSSLQCVSIVFEVH
jgi:hypothetical protein